jgi:glycosyltransferase involved in cell wall biosynthesis
MIMENISVVTVVYNEEMRIRRFLRSFTRFDEIIIVDKSSTDNTASICLEEGAHIVTIPYSNNGDVGKYGLEIARNNWILLVTASDIIHPDLVKKLLSLINEKYFDVEIINVPYMIYCHGINSIYSVFDNNYRPCLVKKENIVLNDRVHEEIGFKVEKQYFLPKDRQCAIFHLTHQTIASSIERAMRYSDEELKKNLSLWACFKNVLGIILLGIKKIFWKIGWDGVAMLFMLLNYHLIIFLKTWEKKQNLDIENYYNKMAKRYETYN